MESDKYKDILLCVDSSLENAKFLDSDLMRVMKLEVWGCGGAEAAESQRRVKEWEKREIMRRRLVSGTTSFHVRCIGRGDWPVVQGGKFSLIMSGKCLGSMIL